MDIRLDLGSSETRRVCEFPAGGRLSLTLLHQCPRKPSCMKNKVARTFKRKVGQTKSQLRPVGSSSGNREQRRRHPVGGHQEHCALLLTLDRLESSSALYRKAQKAKAYKQGASGQRYIRVRIVQEGSKGQGFEVPFKLGHGAGRGPCRLSALLLITRHSIHLVHGIHRSPSKSARTATRTRQMANGLNNGCGTVGP